MYRVPVRTMGFLAGLSLASAADAAVLFVKPTPTGAGDCGSWADACALTDAINSAASGDEVWVRAGVYGPMRLKDGVKIIGGFAGNEISASQSDPVINITTLDGGGTHQVVLGLNNPPTTVLRGFHIRNGYAGEGGGGMHLQSSSPTVVSCVFEHNQAFFFGAAVYIRSTQYGAPPRPRFLNCEFRHNGEGESRQDVQPFGGGAVFAYQGSSTFVNCLFHHNKAGDGGAIILNRDGFAFAAFINCTFAYNTAFHNGGAIFDLDGAGTLYNCILWGNVGSLGPGLDDQIYTGSGGTTEVRYSDVQSGWFFAATNIDANPRFQDVAAGNFNLQFDSPCKDTGSNAYLPADEGDLDWDGDTLETVPMDLGLLPRILGTGVDMGAYETPFCGDGNCDADENSCNCSQDCGQAPVNEKPDSSCRDGIDNDCDTLTDCDDPDCGMEPVCMGIIPTVSEWGLVILTLLLLTAAKIYFGHQPGRAPTR